MKKFFSFAIVTAFLFMLSGCAFAQIEEPVKWKFSSEIVSETEADIIATATIEKHWHVYAHVASTDPRAELEGPMPSKYVVSNGKEYKTIGKVVESKFNTQQDPIFNMAVNYFENKVVFKQRIQFTATDEFKGKGT